MAGMLEAISQAKCQVVDLREREVEAKKKFSEAQETKRRRKKGGAGERYLDTKMRIIRPTAISH